jgi:NTP pyrophosphatase (non-canonical NTP hydrolase)
MTIKELCERSYVTAKSKGWHEHDRSMGEYIALCHSEVSEVLECFRDPSHQPGEIWHSEGGKPEGMVFELADLLIRIGDMTEDLKIPANLKMANHRVSDFGSEYGDGYCSGTVPEQIAGIHMLLSLAYESSVLAAEDSVANYLADAMEKTGYLCRSSGWDLEGAVEEKMRYNETRPHRHGGKRA